MEYGFSSNPNRSGGAPRKWKYSLRDLEDLFKLSRRQLLRYEESGELDRSSLKSIVSFYQKRRCLECLNR